MVFVNNYQHTTHKNRHSLSAMPDKYNQYFDTKNE